MKRLIALVISVPLCVWLTQAGEHKGTYGSSVTMNDETSSDDCAGHLRLYNDDFRATVRDEETRSLPNQPLTITGEHNGGIQGTTWDQPEVSIKLCKQVAAGDESEGRRVLSETKIAVNGSNVSVSSPESDDRHSLGTLLMVKAPRNATLNLSVHNGGVALNRFIGTAEAHAHNGGISFKSSSGRLTAEAQNGGVSINDCGGENKSNLQECGRPLQLFRPLGGQGPGSPTPHWGVAGSGATTICCCR